MNGLQATHQLRRGGPGNRAWLGAAILATLAGGFLPGPLKLVALLPLMMAAGGLLTRRPHLVLLPAILFCPFNFESLIQRIGIPFVNPFNLAWLAAVAVVVLLAWRQRRFPLEGTPIDRYLVFNILVTTLAVVRATQVVPGPYFEHVFMVYQQWLQWLLFFWVVARLVRGVEQARQIVLAVAFMVAVAALFGIKDYVETRAVSGGAIERSQGLFGQANYAASFFAYYLPVLVSVAMAPGRWKARLGLMIAAGLGTAALVLTFGRGGMLALGVSLALLALLRRSRLLLILLVLGGLLLSADPTVRARFAETTSDSAPGEVELDDSSGARLIAWQKALDLARQKPLFGWGLFTFRYIHHPLDEEAAARFGHGRMDVHNGHLNTLVSGGLLASAALYAQFGAIIFWGMLLRRSGGDPFVVALATGLAVAAVAIMIVNLFGTRLYDRQMVGYFWVLLGALHGATRPAVSS